MTIVTLTPETLPGEHICCAISDKKCAEGTAAKKAWLGAEYAQGYRFSRLDVRGKVFLEYGPGRSAWQPVLADDWMVMGCFWVSGQYKRKGHSKALLEVAMQEARAQGLAGLVSVAGAKKMHFQSDGAWLRRQGFEEVDRLENGFCLLALRDAGSSAPDPEFAPETRKGLPEKSKGVTVYYSDRCPYTGFHIETSLVETCKARGIRPKVIKLATRDAARTAPTPATVFSLFVGPHFVTTDLSVCMDSRFDRILDKAGFLQEALRA